MADAIDYPARLRAMASGGKVNAGDLAGAARLIERFRAMGESSDSASSSPDGGMSSATDEVKKVVDSLKVCQWRAAYVFETQNTVDKIQSAIDLIERLAEVERLTPRPMTLDEAVKAMNESEFLGQSTWSINDSDGWRTVQCRRFCSSLHEESAVRIGRDILREKEAARA